MSSHHHHDAPFGTVTPWPIYALGALLLVTLGVVAWERIGHLNAAARPAVQAPALDVLWQRSLRFDDTPTGDIAVTDTATGQTVATFEGQQGFLRGSLRALARSRQRAGQGPEQPFVLTGHTDGRLVLLDPVTGHRINLESFGPTNAAVFARLRQATPIPTSHGGTP
ncbi:MAG: photosynthetic complex assembly protein PuhC [Hydrogenophaga sp.]|nr:photosynthetic complex assembly protein PuhC [Hydrogenophaga sp.]